MLQIKNIHKKYETGGFVQKALDGVSLNLRENEFVAILGPSGSGKTTLLNIIGGLDRYDSGDLIINGISTKKYKDRDWDSYRNHTIGFVFQSYNLIPHQTVLSNVELALTISGISKAERKRRAKEALEQVGLGKQLHKKPSQMSGGQMQRVAIARALVNDPDILLADEPTGALDSETSVQVMELLKQVAQERLVVMVTHNPELAQAYATRIVNLKDGVIRSDSDPYEIEEESLEAPVHKNMGKASMSFLTALSLSFNNLRTKKARTLLTSFAGSIGIIGIALILAISNGVNEYIKNLEEDTLSEYPLQIQSTGMDLTSMMTEMGADHSESGSKEVKVSKSLTSMISKVDPNDLKSLKDYLENGGSGIGQYANAIEYTYNVSPQIYRIEGEKVRQINPDKFFTAMGINSEATSNSMMSSMMNTNIFHEMPENTSLFENQYDVKAGRWPENYNECVVVLTSNGKIMDFALYAMGLRDAVELDDIIRKFMAEEPVQVPEDMGEYSYEDFLGITFKLINASDCYEYDDNYSVWRDRSSDQSFMADLAKKSEDIKIVGVVQPAEGATASMLSFGIGYPASLTRHVISKAAGSRIVRQQLASSGTNVFSGNSFGEDNSQNRFDMSSMFSVDTDALQNAFSFDTDSFNPDMSGSMNNIDLGNIDFSGMIDMSDISFDIPELPELNLGDILGQIDISFSEEGLQKLIGNMVSGYGEYAKDHPEADYSKLNESFSAYLQTPEAQQILTEGIKKIIDSNVEVNIDPEQVQVLFRDLMQGYMEYAAANNLTDPDRFNEYFMMYLQTPEAQQKIAAGAANIIQISGDIKVSPEQTEALLNEVMKGYQEYAAANGLPDPGKIGENFTAYLQTPEAQQQLMEGIAEVIDLDSLEAQISKAIGNYMQSVMAVYTEAIMQVMQTQITAAMQQIVAQISSSIETAMQESMGQLEEGMENAFHIDADAFMNSIQMNVDEQRMTELFRSLMTSEDASYDNNMKKLGYADLNDPSGIDIYPRDFESKASIINVLDDYNSRMKKEGHEDRVISYMDVVGTLMSSVTIIVDVISYVLVAFVAISLVVSSIMIGVITYISVLERNKEIGILRAIGASKHNISQVFNAETFIIGLCAGVIGIVLTLLLLIPANAIIHSLSGQTNINGSLPVAAGIILIILSVFLTLLGGLIPSKKAAKSDPVAALRSE